MHLIFWEIYIYIYIIFLNFTSKTLIHKIIIKKKTYIAKKVDRQINKNFHERTVQYKLIVSLRILEKKNK